MNLIKKILLLLVIIPLNCFAIEFYCDNKVKSNGNFNCVMSNTSNSLAELIADFEYSDELKLIKANYTKGYTSSGSENSIIVNGPGLNAQTTIAVFNFKAPIISRDQTYNIYIKNIKYKYLSSEVNYRDNRDLNAVINVKKSEDVSTTTKVVSEKIFTVKIKVNDKEVIKTCNYLEETCNIDLSDLEIPTKDGYTFNGWNTNIDCEKGYTDTFEVKNDTILYACFVINNIEEKINYLNKIMINDVILDNFDKDRFDYIYEVENDVESLVISADAISSTASIVVSKNASSLIVGDNNIKIDVVDDEITTTYNILVRRLEKQDVDYAPILKSIIVNGKEVTVENDEYQLNISVKYGTKSIDLTPITDRNSSYRIVGNNNLHDGSIIQIIVESSNGVSNTYNLTITYESFISSYMYMIYTIGMITFCLIVYFVVRKIKNDNQNASKNIKKEKNVKKVKTKEKKEKEIKTKEKKVKASKKKDNKKNDEIETLS